MITRNIYRAVIKNLNIRVGGGFIISPGTDRLVFIRCYSIKTSFKQKTFVNAVHRRSVAFILKSDTTASEILIIKITTPRNRHNAIDFYICRQLILIVFTFPYMRCFNASFI